MLNILQFTVRHSISNVNWIRTNNTETQFWQKRSQIIHKIDEWTSSSMSTGCVRSLKRWLLCVYGLGAYTIYYYTTHTYCSTITLKHLQRKPRRNVIVLLGRYRELCRAGVTWMTRGPRWNRPVPSLPQQPTRRGHTTTTLWLCHGNLELTPWSTGIQHVIWTNVLWFSDDLYVSSMLNQLD